MFQKRVKDEAAVQAMIQVELQFIEALPTIGQLVNGENAGYVVTRWQIAERDDESWLSVMNIRVYGDAGTDVLARGQDEGYYVFFAGAASMIEAIAKAEVLLASGEAKLVPDVMAADYVKNRKGTPKVPKKPRKVIRE